MIETQDPLVILQRRMQQRQILAMMGINQWVQPSSETMNMADISAPTNAAIDIVNDIQPTSPAINIDQTSLDHQNRANQNLYHQNSSAPSLDHPHTEFLDATSNVINDALDSYNDHNSTSNNQTDEQSPVTYSFDTVQTDKVKQAVKVDNAVVKTAVQQTVINSQQTQIAESHHITSYDDNVKVAPFDLQGGRYGDWVILVDIQALNHDSQKLWQNITQALSITCETTSFPICAGMDTAELANASLAGYVFKLGRSEDTKVAALTTLPAGLEHPNIKTVPTLDEMLTDSSLKRQLWEQLSNQS